jgi:hypothetical protein
MSRNLCRPLSDAAGVLTAPPCRPYAVARPPTVHAALRRSTPNPLEDELRRLIAAATRAHGRRAAISRQLGHPRGWLSEYVTGKLQHLKIDELAQLLHLVPLDGAQLRQLRAVIQVVEPDRATLTLLAVWSRIAVEHREAALHELQEVAKVSEEIQRLTSDLYQRSGRGARRAARAASAVRRVGGAARTAKPRQDE